MNRRSLRTRNDITQVFLELLAEKPMKNITVKEVADKADVTRATFYSHYNDIYDLLNQARAEAVGHIVTLLDKSIPEGSILLFMTEFFSYFEDSEETFALIFGENGDLSFLITALQEVRERKDSLIKQYGIGEFGTGHIESFDERLNEFQFIYLTGGVLHILTRWLSQKDRISVDEIAAITTRFVENTFLVDISTAQ